MTPTHPFTRLELVEAACVQLNHCKQSGASSYQIEAMHQICDALLDYPLTHCAKLAVKTLVADMKERKGFAELVKTIGDFDSLEKFWIDLLERTVAMRPQRFAQVSTTAKPEEESIELDITSEEIEFT